jgi:hypothetical protein
MRQLTCVCVCVQGIQITATTPTNSAVRLETGPGPIELDLSTRVQNSSRQQTAAEGGDTPPRLFVQMHVNINVALGTLIKNPLFEEADEELLNQALFKTVITMRNALQVCRSITNYYYLLSVYFFTEGAVIHFLSAVVVCVRTNSYKAQTLTKNVC